MTDAGATAERRFTVLMPTHNRADVIGLAIRSVLAQTEADFELLVVADGCTDGTADLVRGLDDARIRLFDLPKAPHFGYANRNLALREARGSLVAYAPHDDLLLPDHLEKLGALLDTTGAGWAYSRPLWVARDGTAAPLATNIALEDERAGFMAASNTIPSCCVVHRRELLARAGWWPEDVAAAADWLLWRRMIGADGGRLARLKLPTSLHFTAGWREGRCGGFAPLQFALAVADAAPWWPAALRRRPWPGEPEQEAWHREMMSGGAAWVEALRGAADVVLARLAWDLLRDTGPRLAAATEDATVLRAAITAGAETAAAQAAALGRSLDAATARADAAVAERAALRCSLDAANDRADAAGRELAAARDAAAAERTAFRCSLDAATAVADSLRLDLAASVQAAHAESAARRGDLEAMAASAGAVRLQLAGAASRADTLDAELAHARERLGRAERANAALLASTSWRMAAPIRALGRGIGALRGRE